MSSFARRALAFEQQCHLRDDVRYSGRSVLDQFRVGQCDGVAPAADPPVAVVRFAEDVEVVSAGGGVLQPGLVEPGMFSSGGEGPHCARADDIPFVLVEGGGHLTECGAGDGNFDIVVLAGLFADEQVQRPSGDNTPRRGNPCEPRRPDRCPRIPSAIALFHADSTATYRKIVAHTGQPYEPRETSSPHSTERSTHVTESAQPRPQHPAAAIYSWGSQSGG
jgi:hypothetical protein